MRANVVAVGLLMAAVSGVPQQALAWGAQGHRMISEAGMMTLPETVPAFLRTPDAVRTIGELGREGDRSKGAGRTHDAERDPGHYIDLLDDGTVFGGPKLADLPPTREEFDTAMRAVGQSQYKAGYLYYSLLDGWLQLRIDFAYWRVLAAAEAAAKDPAKKAEYAADRKLREMLIVRDLGYWSHFVADGSQPLHVSIHFNGWGNFPNPNNYSTSNTIHARFEGEFVRNNIVANDILADLKTKPVRDCACTIEQRTVEYLMGAYKQIIPLYELEGKAAFVPGNAAGKSFALERVSAAAAELRDLVAFAWVSSADASVGYPAVKIADVVAGTADPYVAMFGADSTPMRGLIRSLAAPLALYLAVAEAAAAGRTVVELGWGNLIPATSHQTVVRGVVQHGEPAGTEGYEAGAVVRDYDGETVRLAGFVVPLEFDGALVKVFLLAPYAGACIHVPPPPPNQLVLVTVAKGFRLTNLIDAVVVTGTLAVARADTDLAEAGYRMTADKVEAYRF